MEPVQLLMGRKRKGVGDRSRPALSYPSTKCRLDWVTLSGNSSDRKEGGGLSPTVQNWVAPAEGLLGIGHRTLGKSVTPISGAPLDTYLSHLG